MYTFQLLEKIFPQDIVKYVIMPYITISKKQVENNLVSVLQELKAFSIITKDHPDYASDRRYKSYYTEYYTGLNNRPFNRRNYKICYMTSSPRLVLKNINDYKISDIQKCNDIIEHVRSLTRCEVCDYNILAAHFKVYEAKYIIKMKKYMDAFFQKEILKCEKRNSYLR